MGRAAALLGRRGGLAGGSKGGFSRAHHHRRLFLTEQGYSYQVVIADGE
ncbi:MAG: hypothetical protein WCG85_02600 [Polyangia bacterium]